MKENGKIKPPWIVLADLDWNLESGKQPRCHACRKRFKKGNHTMLVPIGKTLNQKINIPVVAEVHLKCASPEQLQQCS